MKGGQESPLAYVAHTSGGGGPGQGRPVLLVHSWWGLTPSFPRIADELASLGFLVGCVDLYDGKIATTEDEVRRLHARKRAEPAYRLLHRCLQQLVEDERSRGAAPAVVGFSMGAHWAVWLAQHPDPPVSAVVLFYGARGGDFSDASAPVLAHFAAHDEFVSVTARGAMERALARRGLRYESFDYPGTRHWFAEPAHPWFDASAADLAMSRSSDFLRWVDET